MKTRFAARDLAMRDESESRGDEAGAVALNFLASLPARADRVSVADPVKPVERFLVKGRNSYVVVRALDIVWAESAANYVVLHTLSGNHVLRRTLRELEQALEPRCFFRANRSAIVNLDYVREVRIARAGQPVLRLQDDASVPLARSLRELQGRLQGGS